MRFTVASRKIAYALAPCRDALTNRPTDPAYLNAKITAGDGLVTVEATDKDVWVCSRINPESVKSQGSAVVNTSQLLGFCRAVDGDASVSLEGNALVVSVGRDKMSLPTQDSTRLPEAADLSAAKVWAVVEARLLARMLEKTSFMAATEHGRFALAGVCFEVDEEGGVGLLRAVAADGKGLAVFSVNGETAAERSVGATTRFLVPNRAIKVVGFMLYRLHRDHIACHRLAVHSAYRRRGVGAALIRKLVSKLSAHSRPRLVIDVSDENLRGHVFLRAMSLKAVAVTYCGDECNYTFELSLGMVQCAHTGGSY